MRALAADLEAEGVTATVLPVDLADPAGPQAVLDGLRSRGLFADALDPR